MRLFMGYFFLIFGSLKTLQWSEFAHVFAEYDIVAKRFIAYGFAYPAIELLLAYFYLSNHSIMAASWLTIVVLAIGSIGVGRALLSKRHYQCACLGTVVKLPMSTITLIEDVGMGLMAVGMLFLLR